MKITKSSTLIPMLTAGLMVLGPSSASADSLDGLVGYWPLDSTPFVDVVNNNTALAKENVQLVGGTDIAPIFRNVDAVEFVNATSAGRSRMQIPHTANLDFRGSTAALTISLWVQPTAPGPQPTRGRSRAPRHAASR